MLDSFLFGRHLEAGEEILYIVHRHWILLAGRFFEWLFYGLFMPWGLYFLFLRTPAFLWVAVLWTLLALIRFFYSFADWYANVWLVTNMSILQIQWHGIFSNTSSRIGFEDVEGVVYEVHGFWPTMLRYGHITLKVMSGNNIQMNTAANPKKAELELARLQSNYLHHRESHQAGHLKNMLSEMVGHYMRQKLK